MSTILKALRRLEREKSAPVSERPLREAVATAASAPARRRPGWIAPALALLVGVAVGAAALLLWPSAAPEPDEGAQLARREAPPAAPAPRAAERRPKRAVPQPMPKRPARPAPATAAEGPPEEAFASNVEVVPRPPFEPRIAAEPSHRPSAAAEAPPAPAEPEPAAANTRAAAPPAPTPVAPPAPERAAAKPPPPKPAPPPKAVPPPPPAPAPEPEPKLASSSAPEAAAPPAEPPPPPKAAPAPKPAPAALPPTLRVEKTVWHPLAERRVAVVRTGEGDETLRLHEGERVAGYEVGEIKPSGVVFRRDGEELERKVGAQ